MIRLRLHRFRSLALPGLVLAISLSGCASRDKGDDAALAGPLSIERQGSFFVGGRNIASATLSTVPAYAPSGTVSVEQMYVHYQVPTHASAVPLVLIHGCCLTGKTWETTPDGRMGWDEYFLRRGHPVYVIDQVARGRSAADASAVTAVRAGKAAAAETPAIFMAGQEAAWAIFRFGPEYPKTFPGMRFPMRSIDEFWKQMVPDWAATLPTPNPNVLRLSELARKLNGAVLVSHSASGNFPFFVVARSAEGVAGIVSIEPGSCPAAEGDLAPYLRMPILVLWGDYVDQSTRWAPRLKQCREFAAAATKAGGHVENVVLPEIGIHGNSHMLMQDDNSLQIADWLQQWLAQNIQAGVN